MISRRRFMRYAQAGVIASLGTALVPQLSRRAQAEGSLYVESLGHSCFLFSGSGVRVLTNPFESAGCTAGYPSSKASADLVFISSRLLDEGAIEGLPGNPKLLYTSGSYKPLGLNVQGIQTLHDRNNGYQFGTNTVWTWTQGGIKILHLGGIASPISVEQQILMGQPDLLLIPVGGSAKCYNPEEAKAAIATLQPKIVVPTQYKTSSADASCDLKPVDDFLAVMGGANVQRVGGSLSLSASSLPAVGPVIRVMS